MTKDGGKGKKDLTGRRFGHLVVLEKTPRRERGYVVWLCRCDCGNTIFASTRKLVRGSVKDCGCVPRTSARRGACAEDLTGRVFGRLTVVHRAGNRGGRACWLCRCSCGGEKIVSARDLKAGKVRSCGCLWHEKSSNMVDLTGRRFGRLTAVSPTGRRDRYGTVYWMCRCDCGGEIEAPESSLASGACKSCGCLKRENQEKIGSRLHRVDGTCVEFLENRKSRRDNKSGFRGVYRMPNGRYKVSIGFRGKRISLGTYGAYEDAVSARVEAEQRIYGTFLNEYRKWEEKAAEDPEWAQRNPFKMETELL